MKFLDRNTKMISFLAAQGKGKTHTMVQMINKAKDEKSVAIFTENTIDELVNHYGLILRDNLVVIAKAIENVYLQEILDIADVSNDTIFFIDYLQNILDSRNEFLGKRDFPTINNMNLLFANAYKNNNLFYVNLQALKNGCGFRGSGRVIDKLHCLMRQDTESGEIIIEKDRFRENKDLQAILQEIVGTDPELIKKLEEKAEAEAERPSFKSVLFSGVKSLFTGKPSINIKNGKYSATDRVADAIDNLTLVESIKGGNF
ncbi:MAG: hypothetical protein LBV53_02465 [Mycoplasmataceae bacterium]|jgi:hypothetical protein|nr:hypothetical protein [Mycoplasmataceae bacterium]